jgi:hypothetical protein
MSRAALSNEVMRELLASSWETAKLTPQGSGDVGRGPGSGEGPGEGRKQSEISFGPAVARQVADNPDWLGEGAGSGIVLNIRKLDRFHFYGLHWYLLFGAAVRHSKCTRTARGPSLVFLSYCRPSLLAGKVTRIQRRLPDFRRRQFLAHRQ